MISGWLFRQSVEFFIRSNSSFSHSLSIFYKYIKIHLSQLLVYGKKAIDWFWNIYMKSYELDQIVCCPISDVVVPMLVVIVSFFFFFWNCLPSNVEFLSEPPNQFVFNAIQKCSNIIPSMFVNSNFKLITKWILFNILWHLICVHACMNVRHEKRKNLQITSHHQFLAPVRENWFSWLPLNTIQVYFKIPIFRTRPKLNHSVEKKWANATTKHGFYKREEKKIHRTWKVG